MRDMNDPLQFTLAEFTRLVDSLYDEILIYDNNYRLLYINKACERHYGFTQQEMIGLTYWDVVNKHKGWDSPVLPVVYKYRTAVKQEQRTQLGQTVLTIAVPVFDDNNELAYVVLSVRDNIHEGLIPWSTDVTQREENTETEEAPHNIVYRSPSMVNTLKLAAKIAKTDAPCLLSGETGSGKSLLASYIHAQSNRKSAPFIVVNCAAIPQELFESEMFGHVKGAFSGATGHRQGIFAKAEGGTLLLDEISELPLTMQAKLLHTVQDKEYRPVGSSTPATANVRILAASNRNLKRMVDSNVFREDLYFRLNVFELPLPPLRDRQEDIPLLIQNFLRRFGALYGSSKRVSDAATQVLCRYHWPGNVRELAHLIERLVITTEGPLIDVDQLPSSLYEQTAQPTPILLSEGTLEQKMAQCERQAIIQAVALHKTTRKVAKALGVSQTKASRLMRKYFTEKT